MIKRYWATTPWLLMSSLPLAWGQAVDPADAEGRGSGSRLIEEVIVTAQKREQRLQDVPVSIQAFSADVLDAKGILDSKDLPLATPGLTVSTQVNFTSIFLRGVGSDAFLLGDPSVASYVDGIYFPFSNGLIQDFGAVERIEVLKGPQGTLFGRNAIGGAISVVTQAPSFDRIKGSAQISFADYDTLQTRIHGNVPLTDTLALSASIVFNDADNHIDGKAGGKPLPKETAKAGRIKLLWRPAQWTDLNLTVQDIDQQGAGTNYLPTTKPSLLLKLLGQGPQDPYKGEVNEPTFFVHDSRTYYGQLGFYLDGLDIKLLGSDQYLQSISNIDFDGTKLPIARFDILPISGDIQTAELQLLSNDGSWNAERFQWIVGAYLFRSDTGIDRGVLSVGGTDLARGELFGQLLPPGSEAFIAALGNTRLPIATGSVEFVGTLRTKSIAYYSQLSYKFTDWFSLTLGGRYQNEERILLSSTAGLSNLDGSVTQIPGQNYSGLDDPRYRDTTKGFKPKVSLDFRPIENTLIYLSWQKAEKSSLFNIINIYDPPDKAEGEQLEAYELGIKTTLFDGLMSFNAAAFEYTLDHPQVQVVSLLQGGAVAFENGGQAKITGFDFDSLIQLFPSLTDDLIFTAGAAILNPRYTSFPDGTGFDPVTGIRTTGNDYTGNQIVRSPRFSGTAALSKTFATANGALELAVDYYYTSRYFYLAQNLPADEENAYGVVGARVSYLYDPWNLRVTLFGKNIANAHYNYSQFIVDFGTGEARAPLSTYGVRFNWDF